VNGSESERFRGIRAELTRGVECVRREHYADAVGRFAVARAQVTPTDTPLIAALDAFIDGHARYWQAQQGLHEASRRFAVASADQQERFAELQRCVSQLAPIDQAGPADGQDDQSSLPHQLVATVEAGAERPARTFYPGQISHDERGSDTSHRPDRGDALPALRVTLFGRFDVWRLGARVKLCHNRNGQAILRYLVAHPHRRATTDALTDALWPEDDGDTARHKLHVAVSALRHAINEPYVCPKGGGYLLWQDNVYFLNPMVEVTTDVDDFLSLYRSGQQAEGGAAVSYYEEASRLYTGLFLPEDLYADWSLLQREHLTQVYLTMCDALATHHTETGRYDEAIRWAATILAENRCDEAAYRGLMRAYMACGRRDEALRQYQRCERVLAEELGVQPMPETTALFYAIVQGHAVDGR
jgi:DNA-binding SARP family transcriptional activator